jgi:copper/silver efflux system protein
MIRDEDGALTGYIYVDLKTTNYGGFVEAASRRLQGELHVPTNYGYQ